MVRKRSKLSRAAAMLLSVVMILSCFVIIPATDVGAVDLTEEETGIKFVKTVTFEEPYTGNSYTYYKGRDRQRMYVYENNVKKNAYCIQPGTTTGDMTKGQRSAWDALGRDKQRAIALAMYYGFIDSSTTHNSEMYPSGRNFTDNQRWVATQLIIWDLVCGYRDADDYKLNDDRWINSICGDKWNTNNPEYNWQVAWCYKAIANKMIEHKTIMSFTARRSTIAPTYTMKWNGSAYSVTLTDSNKVLKNYSLKTNPNSNIKLSASGNKLTVTSSKPVTSETTMTYQTTIYGDDPVAKVVCYGSSIASIQDVVLATDAVPDPVTAYFKLKTEPVGSLKVTKTYSDVSSVGNFIVNNTKFTVKNAGGQYVKASKSGNNYTFTGTTTDKNSATLFTPSKSGNSYSFTIADLLHGKYTVTEENNSNKTGFLAESTSQNLTVSNTQAVAAFTNSPLDLVIVKQFDIYGDLSDEDYANVTLQVMDSRDNKPILAIPIDTKNNVYQYIDKSDLNNYADETPDLKFINPKVHRITVRGLPRNNNYEVVERNVNTNRFTVEYENAEITNFNASQLVFVTNTEKANGKITVTKDFLSDDGNGNRTEYNDNSVYEHLSFTIKNAAGKYVTADSNGSNSYTYSGLSSTKTDNASFVINISAGKSFTVSDLPYGKYIVTEVMDNELRAVRGFVVDGKGTRDVELTNTNPSAAINYTNATVNNTSLTIRKTFVNSAGEETDAADELYNNISFTITGTRLQLKDAAAGIYEVWTDGSIVTDLKLGTESHTITINGLSAGDYTITENISDSIANMVIANSTFTVNHADGETDTIAADNATAQSRTVRVNDNGQVNIEFINTFVTDRLNIVKESEDGLRERKFSVITLNSDLYPEASPLYVTTDKNGNAAIEDLPVYVFNNGAVEKVKYRVTEVDVLDVYRAISSQDIELVPGTAANTLTFVNELKRGSITVVKIAEQEGSTTTAPLAGVEFTLTNDLDDTELRGTTDNDGKLAFEDLIAGAVINNNVVPITYTLHEVSGRANNSFTLASDKKITLDYTQIDESLITKEIRILNKKIYGGVTLTKADSETKEKLSGAEFTLYNDVNTNGKYDADSDTPAHGYTTSIEAGKTVYTAQSTLVESENDPGYYELHNIPKGKYIVVETKAPKGYVTTTKEFAFEINNNGDVENLYDDIDGNDEHYVLNDIIKGSARAVKVDSETGEKLSGAVFHVWMDSDENGELSKTIDLDCGYMTEDSTKKGEYYITDLKYGTYFVRESKAPEGYERSESTYVFSITENGAEVQIDQIGNTPIKGEVSLFKYDSKDKNKLLTGAEFTVYNDTDGDGKITDADTVYGELYTIDFTRLNSKLILDESTKNVYIDNNENHKIDSIDTPYGKLTDSVQTGVDYEGDLIIYISDGHFTTTPYATEETYTKYTLTNIPYGNYIIKETKAPEGYVLSDEEYPFSIVDQGADVVLGDDNLIYVNNSFFNGIPNKPIEGGVRIKKVAIALDGTITEEGLSGAEYTLYRASDDVPLMTRTSSWDGVANFQPVRYGEYYLKETKAPKGYKLSDEHIPFRIAEDNEWIYLTQGDEPITGQIKIWKDSEDNFVEGIEFVITGTADTGEEINITLTTDENGYAEVTLPIGEYTIHENNPDPAKYAYLPDERIRLQADDVMELRPYNYFPRGTVFVDKLEKGSKQKPMMIIQAPAPSEQDEEEYTNTYTFETPEVSDNQYVSGAEFTIYNADDDSVVGVMTEYELGRYRYDGLLYGDYYLKETKAPKGYERDTNKYPFTVNHNYTNVGRDFETNEITYKGYNSDDYYFALRYPYNIVFPEEPITGNINILKVDKDGEKPLAGARFTLYNSEGEAINTLETQEDGTVQWLNVPYGKYTVQETKAPENYKLDDTVIDFSVTKSKTYTVTRENESEKGKGYVTKTAEDGAIEGLTFKISGTSLTGSEVNVTLTTDKDGKTETVELPIGTYTVEETNTPDKYITPKTKKITIKTGKTTSVSFNNVLKKGTVRVTKVDKDYPDNKLTGAEFEVYDKDGNTVGQLVESETGIYTLSDLPYGDYTLKETKAPKGFVLDTKSYSFKIRKNGKIVDVETEAGKGFINDSQKGELEIIKTSEDGVIENVEFHIYGTALNGHNIDITRKTDKNGKIDETGMLAGTYTVEEISVADRYIAAKAQTVVVSEGNVATVTFNNVLKKGTVRVTKVDKDYPDNKLTGAEFEVYDKDGTTVGQLVESETGIYTLSDLPYGDYTLKETKAPKGFVLDTKSYSFKIRKNGKIVDVETEAGKGFINDSQKGELEIIKTSEDGVIENVEFHIYGTALNGHNIDITRKTDKNGKIDETGILAGTYTVEEINIADRYIAAKAQTVVVSEGEVATVTFNNILKKGTVRVTKTDKDYPDNKLTGAEFEVYDKDGTTVGQLVESETGIYTLSDLPYGDYTLKETKAPKGFVLDTKSYSFKIRKNGKIVDVETEAGKGFINDSQKGELEIIKTSEDGVIENVEFHIYGTALTGQIIDITRKTDKNGKIDETGILAGTYTVEEINIADRYIAAKAQTVVVSEGEVATVTFNNVLKKGTVRVTKVDKDYPDNKLTGAEFEVYDKDGNTVGQLVESETGIYTLSDLPYGDYTLKETKAPKGFVLDTKSYSFKIRKNGKIVDVETEAGKGFINDSQKGELVIQKRSSDGKLEGFSFRITGKAVTGEEYDQTFTTNAEGKITIEGLRIGTYTVSEVASEATARYDLPADKTVEIKTDDIETVEMYNDEREIPFEITKKDISTGELIPNCGFRIRNSSGEIVIEGYTDENGIAKFELVCGDYTYQEFDAPEGYIIDEKEYPFTIKPDDTIVKAEMTNVGTGTIEITKKDISTGELIPNTSFRVKDENGNTIIEGVTDENGVARFRLQYGKYTYEEYDAPEGYIIETTPYPFEIKKNGEIIKAEMTNTGTGTIEITKTDIATGKLIPDCGIEIIDENKDVIVKGRTDENGIVRFKLPYGKYFYREFDAPDGYILDETPYPFEIKENGEIVKAEMTNTAEPVIPDKPQKDVPTTPGYITTPDTPDAPDTPTPDTPVTGDNTSDMVVLLMVVMISALAVVFVSKKRRHN